MKLCRLVFPISVFLMNESHLQMFVSTHYAGDELALQFASGETWKKVFGPVFVYLNSDVKAKENPSLLWQDAKQRVMIFLAHIQFDYIYISTFNSIILAVILSFLASN